MSEESKAVVRRYNELFVECWRTGDVDLLDEVLAQSSSITPRGTTRPRRLQTVPPHVERRLPGHAWHGRGVVR